MKNKHIEACFQAEVLMSGKKFSWLKLLHRAVKCPDRRFYFWLRLCQMMVCHENYLIKKLTRKIHRNLNQRYATDIAMEAIIGPGLKIGHFTGIVIRPDCIIGKNLTILQNCTIGIKHQNDKTNGGKIIIGDNVFIGANSCVIGNIQIGDDVTIGAMSFVNKDIASNLTVYTEKKNAMIKCIH